MASSNGAALYTTTEHDIYVMNLFTIGGSDVNTTISKWSKSRSKNLSKPGLFWYFQPKLLYTIMLKQVNCKCGILRHIHCELKYHSFLKLECMVVDKVVVADLVVASHVLGQ